MKKRHQRITAKQEAFAQAIVAGKGPSEAYRSAYAMQGSARVVSVHAQDVLRHWLVAARIKELRDRAARPAILSRQAKLERLARAISEQVTKKNQLTPEQIRAIEIDNRMQGHNEPEQLKVTGLGSVMQKIRRDAPKP